MYSMKPVFEYKEEFKIKTPLYLMRNISSLLSRPVEENAQDSDTLYDIESRQDKLLKQIHEIEDLLSILKAELSEPKTSSVNKDQKILLNKDFELDKTGIVHEVVLNASVKNPPFSLLALNKLWPDLITFVFSTHIHSSIKGLPKDLKIFDNLNRYSNGNMNVMKFRIRVVWKEVWSGCELIISPLHCSPLSGEVNFLRFLHNCLLQKHIDNSKLTLFETKLDICYCLQYCDNYLQLQEYYSLLSEGLDKNKWLIGDQVSIVDLACWSVIRNLKNPNLNSTLRRWFDNFNEFIAGSN